MTSHTGYYDLLAGNFPAHARKPALVDAGRVLTYEQLAAAVDELALQLQCLGVCSGDRVVVHLFKSIEEVVAILAVARLGAVFVVIHHQWTLGQLSYVLEDCGARVAITDSRRAHELASLPKLPGILEHVIAKGHRPDQPGFSCMGHRQPAADTLKPHRLIDADLAAILYTSGSTGRPKGVMLSNHNLIAGAWSVAEYLDNTQDDRVISILPFSFDYGLNQLNTMLLVGGTIILQGVIMPAEIVRTIQRERVTGMAAVPPLWIQMIRYLQTTPSALPSLRYITNSGGKIPKDILKIMPDLLPGVSVFLMYGLTESFRSTYLPPEFFREKMGAIGRAIPNAEIYVIKPDGVCGPGEQGELVHRGSLISMGYWGKPEATAEKIKPCAQLRHLIGEEKVVYSGDLVRIDEDGVLWFVSRMDTMIKSSGFRISPTEVEEVVYSSGMVTNAVAFGAPDEMMGEVVEIVVSVPDEKPTDLAMLRDFCRRAMPSYMVPKRIHLWKGSMPRTASGKIDVPAVVQACRDDSTNSVLRIP